MVTNLNYEFLHGEIVYLNVYHVTCFNSILEFFGVGIYHSSIEVYKTEYTFGWNNDGISGIIQTSIYDNSPFSNPNIGLIHKLKGILK